MLFLSHCFQEKHVVSNNCSISPFTFFLLLTFPAARFLLSFVNIRAGGGAYDGSVHITKLGDPYNCWQYEIRHGVAER